LLAEQLRQAGIPFEEEFRFAPPRRWRSDFLVGQNMAWPVRGRFLIEVDGGAYVAGRHTRGAGFEADLEKLNAAALLGYRILRFTPAMVQDGRALAVIRQALGYEVAA
jgi:hypothetical protein